MENWETVFGSYSNSSVYNITNNTNIRLMKKAAIKNGLDFTYMDLKKVVDKDSFLMIMSRTLKFPTYFGMNWDALNDCLTDMSWKPAIGYVIVFTNFKSISENMAAEIQIIRNIFDSSAQYWKQKKVQFYIVLSE
jgi:RNAse (barnase) inhibitor barstar